MCAISNSSTPPAVFPAGADCCSAAAGPHLNIGQAEIDIAMSDTAQFTLPCTRVFHQLTKDLMVVGYAILGGIGKFTAVGDTTRDSATEVLMCQVQHISGAVGEMQFDISYSLRCSRTTGFIDSYDYDISLRPVSGAAFKGQRPGLDYEAIYPAIHSLLSRDRRSIMHKSSDPSLTHVLRGSWEWGLIEQTVELIRDAGVEAVSLVCPRCRKAHGFCAPYESKREGLCAECGQNSRYPQRKDIHDGGIKLDSGRGVRPPPEARQPLSGRVQRYFQSLIVDDVGDARRDFANEENMERALKVTNVGDMLRVTRLDVDDKEYWRHLANVLWDQILDPDERKKVTMLYKESVRQGGSRASQG